MRTDVYAYVNLTGTPYCNAARNCEHLIENYHLFVGSQSVLYFYRISAYAFLLAATLCTAYGLERQRINGNVDFLSLVFAALLSYCLLNYFVDLHANLAEGVQISYLLEQTLDGRTKGQGKGLGQGQDRFEYRHEINAMEKTYHDGQFC